MQKSTSKLLRSLSLARAGLAPALAILLLGAAAPRLAAQSDNFDEDGAIAPGPNAAPGWATYSLGDYPDFNPPYYGAATFSFPTNPASADNYAYRMYAPAITNDSLSQGPARAGSFRTDVQYGNESDSGRFLVGVDLVAWNTNSGNWPDQVFGLSWYISDTNLLTTEGYFGGWGPDLGTLGIIAVNLGAGSAGDITAAFAIIGLAAPEGSYALDPTHQYRMETSSHDGATFLVRLFDLAQPNSPWLSCITYDTTYQNTPGYCGIFEANYDLPPPESDNSTAGVDVTWDNYAASLPAAPATYAMRAVVTDLSPQPAGKAPAYNPTVNVGILNRDTSVYPPSILLYLDGVQIPQASLTIDSEYVYKPDNPTTGGPGAPWPTSFPGATVTYVMTNLFKYGSLHTNMIVFQDYETRTSFTNIWSWTATGLTPLATNGSLSVRGFDARLVQSLSTSTDPAVYTNYANIACAEITPPITSGEAFGNSVAAAQAVLNYQYWVSYAATNIAQLVDFDRNSEALNGIAATNFPGCCLPAGTSPDYVDSYAVEVFAYLQLPAGTNRFMLYADDAARISTGTNLTADSTILGTVDVSSQTFDWFVPQAGLYPIHIIFEEGWGGSYLCLYSVNPDSSLTLVNAAGGVQAYYPLVVESSTSIKGPYTVDAAANAGNQLLTAPALCESGAGTITNLTVTGGTLTLPASGPPKYYRLDGPRATQFTGAKRVGSNVVITYQAN